MENAVDGSGKQPIEPKAGCALVSAYEVGV